MSILNDRLWYRRSAQDWNEALPIGNGRLGAMVFGGVREERLQLNEDTLWTGIPTRSENPGGADAFRRAQALSLAGDQQGAQKIIEEEHCRGMWSQMYVPMADLCITTDHQGEKDYVRELDMSTAVHTVTYTFGGVRYTRECFVSAPHQALIIRFSADQAARLDFCATLKPALLRTALQNQDGGQLLTGNCPIAEHRMGEYQWNSGQHIYGDTPEKTGMGYAVRLHVCVTDGQVHWTEKGAEVKGATQAVLMVTARTSFAGWDKHPVLEGKEYLDPSLADMEHAGKIAYDVLKDMHVADHSAMYNRMGITICGDEEMAALPTDERMKAHKAGAADNGLYELCFNHARYLTIAGSRMGSQPMNLQGVWNELPAPPWHCNYTMNINTEMNYWPTMRMGLPECMEPMLSLVKDLTLSGQWAAREYYGANGACAHHNTDLWRMTNPVGAGCRITAEYAFWPFGLCWLCRSAWEYVQFTGDEKVLREVAYPAIRASARFLLDTMIMDKGEWIFCPATSAEHYYKLDETGENFCNVDRATGMKQQMARDVFEMCIEAEKALGLSDLTAEAKVRLACLKGLEMDSFGRIAEFDVSRTDAEDQHRHVSHLYAMYPAQQITADMPEWANAVRKTLDMRGDESTGWAMAWRINLWARLRDGDRALKLLSDQLLLTGNEADNNWQAGGTYANMFCAHPPFQIDGNFGAASGMMEMLCQVEKDGAVTLLPALPSSWKNGEVHGLCLPGNRKLSMRWQDGKVVESSITDMN